MNQSILQLALGRTAMLVLAAASVASAQNQTWIRQFGSSSIDEAGGAAPDGSSGVYVCGTTGGSLGGPHSGQEDVWLARYDSAGNQTWIRQFGTNAADWAHAAAPDGSGGVYVSGETGGSLGGPRAGGNYDAWLARYDGAGNRIWIRQFGMNATDYAYAAAPDGVGGVYVSGFTFGSLGGPSAGSGAWLAHYDSAGNQSWIRQFGTSEWAIAYGAAPDGSGGVFVGGVTQGSLGGPNAGQEDVWLAHYDSAGNQTWIRQFGTNISDYLYAAAPDGSGGVYVSGATRGSLGGPHAGGNYDAWLARFDGAGNQTWIRQFGSNGDEDAWAAAPDGSGGVYVSGRAPGSPGGSTPSHPIDAWIARYDGAGNQTWIRQFGTTIQAWANAAATDGSGGVYVSGYTGGSLGGASAGQEDVWLAHYDRLTASKYCTPAVQNSTGQSGVLTAAGSNAVLANDVTLLVSLLSHNSFGIFLTSRDQGITFPMSNSQGRLCLGGFIGRYIGAGQLMNSGPTGTFSLALDLNSMPQPFGNVAVQPGDTWNFQAWYRDANPSSTSNFTDAVVVTFH